MKVALEIPKEFEQDFQSDRFNCFFGRVSAEISSNLKEGQVVLCGNYERETADMFLEAFKNAIILGEVTNG